MNTKNITILIIILVLVVVASGFVYQYRNSILNNVQKTNTAFGIEDKQTTYNIAPLKVNITYPYIAGLDDFNQKSKTIVDKEFSDFQKNSLENDTAVKETDPVSYAKYPREYELDIGYDKGEVDKDIVSVIFNVYNFEGGAHGASYFVPLNYNVQTKQEINLVDLFPGQSDYLQKISDFCIKNLTKQITEKLGSTEGSWLEYGARPVEENFKPFLINADNTITFYFPQYQVIYGAAGDFKVIYPYRTPEASVK